MGLTDVYNIVLGARRRKKGHWNRKAVNGRGKVPGGGDASSRQSPGREICQRSLPDDAEYAAWRVPEAEGRPDVYSSRPTSERSRSWGHVPRTVTEPFQALRKFTRGPRSTNRWWPSGLATRPNGSGELPGEAEAISALRQSPPVKVQSKGATLELALFRRLLVVL